MLGRPFFLCAHKDAPYRLLATRTRLCSTTCPKYERHSVTGSSTYVSFPDWRYLIGFWPFFLVALLVAWWTQPHFGWNYCLLGGAKNNSEFITDIYPHYSSFPAAALNSRPDTFRLPGMGPRQEETQARVDDVFNQAYTAMAACYSERSARDCRYAGPDEKAVIHDDQERFSIAESERPRYRYILPGTGAGMSIIPLESGLGSRMTIIDYTNNWAVYRTVCDPGCGCTSG